MIDALCNLVPFVQLKNRENIKGRILHLVKLQETLLNVTLLYGCFLCLFLNCKNGAKTCKTSHIFSILKNHLQHNKMFMNLFPLNVFAQGKDNSTLPRP